MGMKPLNKLAMTAAAFGISLLPDKTPKPPRDECVGCGGPIPPGKPGRKCKDCRNPPKSCEGCGACCREMHSPPGWAMYAGPAADYWIERADPEDEDWQIFQAIPEPVKQELREFYANDNLDGDPHDPCFWYDPETKGCRHYEHRPTICREFEIGEPACHRWRRLYQIG